MMQCSGNFVIKGKNRANERKMDRQIKAALLLVLLDFVSTARVDAYSKSRRVPTASVLQTCLSLVSLLWSFTQYNLTVVLVQCVTVLLQYTNCLLFLSVYYF